MSDTIQSDTFRGNTMKTCTPAEQERRQRLGDTWEPNGFQRYIYQRALLHEMPVLGGAGDQFGASPERYRPTSSCQDTLDCNCGR